MANVEAFPLYWPEGVKRTVYAERSKFKTGFGAARNFLFDEIRRMGGTSVVLSTNIPLRNDGMPRANMPHPKDAGIAVYFRRNGKDLVFACDKFHYTYENIYAIGKTLEALRGIERWGGKEVMDRSFSGFAALPAKASQAWRDVLGFGHEQSVSREGIESQFRILAKRHHPDSGGDRTQFELVVQARADALSEVSA